jgi:hypothetical protein
MMNLETFLQVRDLLPNLVELARKLALRDDLARMEVQPRPPASQERARSTHSPGPRSVPDS